MSERDQQQMDGYRRRSCAPDRPIDFEAPDGLPVDLIFMLIAPESAGADHLKALAMSARLLRNAAVVAKLRATRDPTALYALLTMAPTWRASYAMRFVI